MVLCRKPIWGHSATRKRENTRRNVMQYSTKSTHLHTWGNSYVSWVMKCVWDFCKKYRHYTSDENVQYHLNLSHTKKHQLLQDGNAIKPSKWVVSSFFFFFFPLSLYPLTSTVLHKRSNLAGALAYIFKRFFLTFGLLSTRQYPQVASSLLSPPLWVLHLLCCNPFSDLLISKTHPYPCTAVLVWILIKKSKVVCLQTLLLSAAGEQDEERKRHRTKCSTNIKVLR